MMNMQPRDIDASDTRDVARTVSEHKTGQFMAIAALLLLSLCLKMLHARVVHVANMCAFTCVCMLCVCVFAAD